MLDKREFSKCEKLLDKLYSKCTYNEFLVAFDVAVRAYQRISKMTLYFIVTIFI